MASPLLPGPENGDVSHGIAQAIGLSTDLKKKAGFVERSDTTDGGVNGNQPGVIYVMAILSIQNGRRFTSMPMTCFVS